MNTSQKPSIKGAAITLAVVAIIVAAATTLAVLRPAKKVSNFSECINAGGARMESYPEQCLWEGRTYVNEDQRFPKESGYVGMTEDEALLSASENKIPARVVERNGEGLPVTMDFVPGRQNFFVKDNIVYKVQVEGEETEN